LSHVLSLAFSAILFPSAISLQPKKSPIKRSPPYKSLVSSFIESFIPSGKQGDGAMVLGEGCDIVTGEICLKQLRKSS
jgi:hypothetical protein